MSQALLSDVAGRPVRTPVSLLHAGMPSDGHNKQILFLAEPEAKRPFALVKWARGAAVPGLRREQEALQIMQASGNEKLASSCPRCWGLFESGGDTAILLQSCVPGRPAYAQLRASVWPRQYVGDHFAGTSRWLTHFSAATKHHSRPFDASILDEFIEQPLRAIMARFGDGAVPPEAFKAVSDAARLYMGHPVSPVAEHGDLWVGNLLFSRSRLCVVDWEHFVAETLPGFDMLLFCITYALHFPWRPFGWESENVAFSRALLHRTWLTRHIKTFLAVNCANTGLPTGLVPIMVPVVLARMALREAECSPGKSGQESTWLGMLQTWWNRPRDNWLEEWAGRASS
ncbi:MAG: phosphotransferase [Chloroflexota bacterium]